MTEPNLSIVIPAYNEAGRIGSTLTATRAYLDARVLVAEVLVVDDGSRDHTTQVVEEHMRRDARVRLIRLGRNQGKGAAVRRGMLDSHGARVLFMDADLATPLAELEKLERALDDGADVAIGSRAMRGSNITVHQHFFRETMGKTFNLMVRALAVRGIHDTQCGFKLFTRNAADALFGEASVDRFAFDVEVLMLAEGRFNVREVPIEWHHVEESKVSPVRDSTRTAIDLLRMRARLVMRRRRG
ncbi:MAG: dolichyl-phosphate beta-glucosyltransferase [Deltaproteobacteria bacterium]